MYQKKKRGLSSLMAGVVLLALALSGCGQKSIASGFAGGTGTAENPYRIETAEQLALVRSDLAANYVLAADIDLSGTKNWEPIGDVKLTAVNEKTGEVDFANAFSGSFDGGGHTVSNLTCTAGDDSIAAGLFGCLTGKATNLTLENVVVTGGKTNMAIGGAAGYGMGAVTKVTLQGNNMITGINCVGGIVGGNQGTVSECAVKNADIVVIGDNDFSKGLIQCDVAECGGLVVGGSFRGTVNHCDANGTVTAKGNEPVGLGGIAGCIQCAPSITDNTVTVTINAGNGHAIGGLCGYAGMGDDGDGTVDEPCVITNCKVNATINANGATHVGGLVGTGLYYYGMEDRFTVENCSVTGSISGAAAPGTVAGRAMGSKIISCETAVAVDGVASTNQIGTTDRMYQGGDQYEDGSKGAATRLLAALDGTYEELWPVILNAKYNEAWLSDCTAVVGAGGAAESAKMLQASCSGTDTGEKAVAIYKGKDSYAFNCSFTGGVRQFTFDGTTIRGIGESGKEIFSHSYHFESYDKERGFYIYKTDDANAGEFTYFAMAPDTPAMTYHIEFRYGGNVNALCELMSGQYAYWMAAGIPVNCGDRMAESAINLFCIENLSKK